MGLEANKAHLTQSSKCGYLMSEQCRPLRAADNSAVHKVPGKLPLVSSGSRSSCRVPVDILQPAELVTLEVESIWGKLIDRRREYGVVTLLDRLRQYGACLSKFTRSHQIMRGLWCPRVFMQRIYGQAHAQHYLATRVNTTQYARSCASHSHEIPLSSSNFAKKERKKKDLGEVWNRKQEKEKEEGHYHRQGT